ncbi:MAG: large-conductance mechanosensitive channel protein MscL [Bacteroidaceae bacterium]|nr:large-conductance mechanosensitive channel protein MscL [Bacteroidaceae bacterium]
MGFIQDFKAFAMKGNVIDMAVGVIIGGAFGKIVTSLVNDVIMPPIGILVGGVDFKDLKLVLQSSQEEVLNEAGEVITPAVAEVTLNYGNFLQQTFDFLIIAFSIFCMIRIITKLGEMRKKEEEAAAKAAPAPAPKPSAEEKLLTEIRDLLKEKK